MTAEPIVGPEPLTSAHQVDEFDCGTESLNDYLKNRALSDQSAGKSRTYVIARGGLVIGYFSLASSIVEPVEATVRAAKGQGKQAIPAILLGRLAVDRVEQGHGLGEALLVEALRKSIAAAEIIGARVVLVHAINDGAKDFYLKYGFEQSPCHELLVMMLMKDVRRSYGLD